MLHVMCVQIHLLLASPGISPQQNTQTSLKCLQIFSSPFTAMRNTRHCLRSITSHSNQQSRKLHYRIPLIKLLQLDQWSSNPFSPPVSRTNWMLKLLLRKASPVTGRGGPLSCETSRLPHFLDNRFTDDDEVVSLTHQAIPVTGCGDP
jgi:hypothetical protein